MRLRLIGLAATLCVIVGCGTSTPTTSPTSSEWVAPASTTAPSTSTTTTPSPSTSVPSDVAPSVPFVEAPLDPLGARPRTDIPWPDVGEGWTLFTFGVPTGALAGEPPSVPVFAYGLYLMSPQDAIYGVLGWSSGAGGVIDVDGTDVRAAVVSVNFQPVEWLDLVTLEATPFPTLTPTLGGRTDLRIDVSEDGASLLVTELSYDPPDGPMTRARLSRVSLDGATWQPLVDVELDPSFRSDPLSYLELDTGDLVTIAADEMSLRRADGEVVRPLQLPSTKCRLVGEWADGRVLVSCADPSRAEECWTRGLWLVSPGGEPAEVLALPTGEGACYMTYGNAFRLGTAVALDASHGEGECETAVEVVAGTTWQPAEGPPCNAHLVGVREGAWLVLARSGPSLVSHNQPGTLYEVAPDGTSRALTPVELDDDLAVGVTTASLLEEPGGST